MGIPSSQSTNLLLLEQSGFPTTNLDDPYHRPQATPRLACIDNRDGIMTAAMGSAIR
jgi:hypothetical protein